VVSSTCLTLLSLIGPYVFVLYGITTLAAGAFVLFLVPETKGVQLEQMHAAFSRPLCCGCGGSGGEEGTPLVLSAVREPQSPGSSGKSLSMPRAIGAITKDDTMASSLYFGSHASPARSYVASL
jgi:hypothetical protein